MVEEKIKKLLSEVEDWEHSLWKRNKVFSKEERLRREKQRWFEANKYKVLYVNPSGYVKIFVLAFLAFFIMNEII